MSDWRERIVKIEKMRVGDILPNDHNARVHPPTQDAAVTQSLESVGKADVLRAYYSERNGGKLTLWDGHARQNLDPDQVWNVAITDLTDGEADQMLLTFDPLAGMAEWDKELTDQLLRLNDDLGGELAKLAADVADLAGLDFDATNKEISLPDTEEKLTLEFELSLSQFQYVTQALARISDDKSDALLKVLGYNDVSV